jgi:Baseplate J-like protein
MASSNYVPSVDYTSRDYTAILSDMTALIPNFSPNWTNRDPSDFGMTLLELFAYMGDILNYYIDRSSNESFITTATQRQSVLALANMLGYTPTNPSAATTTLSFTNTSTAGPVTLPALTQVATSLVSNATTTQIIFETDTDVTIPAATVVGDVTTAGTATVTATQGQTVTNEIVGTSDGTPNQIYSLYNYSVINNSIVVNINGVTYNSVPYLIDYSGYSPVFAYLTDSNNITHIAFGDSVSGRIPPNGAQIYATYRYGGGSIGNVAAGTLTNLIYVPGGSIPAGVTVTNAADATGGADAESTDSIRINAPLSLRAVNRAVSLGDYASLAVQIPNVSKAIATASVYTSITLYIAPSNDPGVAADNSTPTTIFNNLVPVVTDYFINKAPANTTITVQPPTYAGVQLVVSITVAPQYRQSSVANAVKAALANLFAYNNVLFHDTIRVADVTTAINSVDGVLGQTLTKLVRTDADQTYTINNKALTSNVATLTTSTTHTLTVGQTVSVTGVDSTFNGTYVVTGVTSNTFSYTLIATNVVSTSATGSVTALTVTDIVCAINEIPTIYALPNIGTLTINAYGGILN